MDGTASVTSISSISNALRLTVDRTIKSLKSKSRGKSTSYKNKKRGSSNRGKESKRKVSSSSNKKRNSDKKFQATWLESQKASRRNKRVFVIVLIFLWASVVITFLTKPWKRISRMKERKRQKKLSLENIKKSEQSHILLCRALIDLDSENLDEISNTMIIEEDRRVCLDRNNPHSSLLQIFTSSLVAQAAKHLKIEYRHKCNPRDTPRLSKSSAAASLYTSIQETLKSKLFSSVSVDKNTVKQLCYGCIQALGDEKQGNTFLSGPECILHPIITSKDTQTNEDNLSMMSASTKMLELILPHVTEILFESAEQWSLTTPDSMNMLRGTDEEKKTTTMIDPQKVEEAIIYLSCAREHNRKKDCDVHALPYYIYVKEIPSTVDEITILASTSCAGFSSSCSDYGRNMQKFLKEWYPRSKVNFEVSQTTAMSYSRMIRTSHLVCVVSSSCILPALVTEGDATLIESPTHYPWLPSFLNNVYIDHVTLLPSSTPVEYTRSVSKAFLIQDPKSRIDSCKEIRGRKGSWQMDLEFAKLNQYKLPCTGYAGAADANFQPSKGNIFRSPTTFKWVENVFPMCNVDYLTLDTLCASLDVMMISRIFILGDSLSLQMVQSLWKLLGHLDNYAGDQDSNASRRVQCPAPYDIDFEIAFTRNDRLMDVETGPQALDDKNCQYGYCWPFVERYKASPDRTLLIANTGAHSHEHSIFYDDFDTFVNLMDSFNRPNDIVWFRTSVPGHKDCDAENLSPFKTYDEYVPTITEVYSWDKFIDYNDYASRVIRERSKKNNLKGPAIDILDVYPMTVLRPDGHAGGADCVNCGRDDCLHYSLPGPVDWWNHLMLSNLVDTASRG